MSIVAGGVGIEHLIGHDPGSPPSDADRWLLCGAIALGLLALGVLHLTTLTTTTSALRCEIKARWRFGGAVAALAVGPLGSDLRPWP